MKAHKVPATYYSAWKAENTNHSFYVFYKNKLNIKGKSKTYKAPKRLTQEHSYFIEEDFYYIKIWEMSGAFYKLQNEVNEFLDDCNYRIICKDFCDEDTNDLIEIEIDDYEKFMKYRDVMEQWEIYDQCNNSVCLEDFKNTLEIFIFDRVGTLIEEYFANNLEPKWNYVVREIDILGKGNELFRLRNKQDFLEFFVIQYLRLDNCMEEYIRPELTRIKNIVVSMGIDESSISQLEKTDGIFEEKTYFYGWLLDIAKGNVSFLQKNINMIDSNYILDLLCTDSDIGFLTSPMPCVVTKWQGDFKAEMLFPVSPKYCIRFCGKKLVHGRVGKCFLLGADEVRKINNEIINQSNDIVMSEVEYISDRI